MKSLFKKVAASLAILAFATTAFAASTNDGSIKTLKVTDKSLSLTDWQNSATVSVGEKLNFQLHYYLKEGESASDMRFSVDNLIGDYNSGDSITVNGKITASGLSTASDNVSVTFAEDLRLEFYTVSWQKYPCDKVACEENLTGNELDAITSGGVSIGSVSGDNTHYTGNVIIAFKAFSNGGGGSNGDDVDVTTNSASSIDEDSAKLNGEMEGDDNIDVWFAFEEGDSTPSCSASSQEEGTNNIDDGQSYSYNVTGLDEDTTYYFRACAEEDNGDIVSGNIRSFTTDDEDDDNNNDEDITTKSATNIDDDSAKLNGEWEGEDNTEVWFAFDEDDNTPSCNSSSQEEGNTNVDDGEDFSDTVHGLDRNEKYYFRACAYDEDNDIISGSIRSFTTDDDDDNDDDDDDVDVTTDSATNVDEDSAKLNGEVEGDDNIEVWFAISRTDTTPSCSVSSQTISVSGSYDDNEDFSKTVTNLKENEKYYFRACAEDTDGDTVSGNIRTFVTDDEGGNGGGGDDDASTITNIASGVGTNSATLNSLVFGDGNATCYFQYGRTTTFGASSPAVFVNLDNSNRCSATRFGLSSGTTYYYRSVLNVDGETHYGLTRSFRTNTVFVAPRPPVTPTTPVIIIEEDGELDVMKWVSSETDPEFDPEEVRARRGETVFYKVRVKNNTGETLENITLIDRIPYYLELDTRKSLDDDADKQVRWTIDTLRDGKSRTFITEMRVREDAFVGDEIESYATAFNDEINVNSNDVIIDVRSGSLATDEEITDEEDERNTQGASIFNSGFFPTSLVGWLVLLLVIFAIAYFLSRIFFTRNENNKVIEELRAMEAAKMNG